MSMVVGVDTHKKTHSAALLNELGVVQGGLEVSASATGYQQLLSWARANSEYSRVLGHRGAGTSRRRRSGERIVGRALVNAMTTPTAIAVRRPSVWPIAPPSSEPITWAAAVST